jgi:hypothetical protein
MSHRTLFRLLAGVGALALVLFVAPAAGAAKVKTTSCDNVDPRYCLLPWPNNHFTAYNLDTETRRQVRLPAAASRSGPSSTPAPRRTPSGC